MSEYKIGSGEFTDQEREEMYQSYIMNKTKTNDAFINGQKISFVWPDSDKDCFLIILNDWREHNTILNQYITANKSVLMAGGNAGLYPFLYSLRFKKVYTFEPEHLNFLCLTQNCSGPDIIKFNCGLSDKHGFVGFKVSLNNVGMHHIVDHKDAFFEIYTITIDSLNLQELSLIHLDTEGHELKVLHGATETLKRCKPAVLLDISLDEKEIHDFLVDKGYKKVIEYGAQKTGLYMVE